VKIKQEEFSHLLKYQIFALTQKLGISGIENLFDMLYIVLLEVILAN